MKNIILCGVGGQGILLAAKIIAAAAGAAGLQVATNEIHGMAQRGGSVTASLRIGTGFASPIFPEGEADLMLSLEAAEAVRCAHMLKPDGTAVVSALRIIPVTVSSGKAQYPADVEERLHKLFSRLVYHDFAADGLALGNLKLANTAALGALSAFLPEIGPEIWSKAITSCVKPALVEINLKAFETGRKTAI